MTRAYDVMTAAEKRAYSRERERRRVARAVGHEPTDEECRAHWRENGRQYRRRVGMRMREPRTETRMRSCCVCSGEFAVGRSPSGRSFRSTKTCGEGCRQARRNEIARARRGRPVNVGRAPWNKGRGAPRSCPVRYASCVQCGALFAARSSGTRNCSATCRLTSARRYAREYQRRTHKTAINYWRIAPTPEATALAATYYELRQALRTANG